MPRPYGGFGGRYQCPDCHQSVDREKPHQKLGFWMLHPDCTVLCPLCGEQIQEPAIGSARTVSAYCGEPVHTHCKENL